MTWARDFSEHYSIKFEPDEEGWWHGSCKCGVVLGAFPSAEDACDALMDHAYMEGVKEPRPSARST